MALRFGSNNRLGQRLMAAGASPERAQQFVQQKAFETGAPVGMPTAATRPKGPNEWYNETYQNSSAALYPKGFRPPKPDDPQFGTYYDFIFGKGSYQKEFDKAIASEAPEYRVAALSIAPLDQTITKMIKQGYDLTKIQEYLRSPAASAAGSLKGYTDAAGQKNVIAALTADQAIFRATEIFDSYQNAKVAVGDKLTTAAKNNKDYKFGLPDPKLRYGTKTDLSKGTVDVLTNPAAAKYYAEYVQSLGQDRMAAQKAASYLNALVAEVNKRQITPWKDEAKRRDSLKGKKIGG